MPIGVPQGFRLAGVHCGLKRDPDKLDLALVVSDVPAVAVGVYTKNQVQAAPVILDRERTPSDKIRALVINSGNANACTGQRGLDDAKQMTQWAAEVCGASPEHCLVLSTGIIGEFLPMEKIQAGIQNAASNLASDSKSLIAAARAMMTTDTVHKLAGRSLDINSKTLELTGMAKGAAMIGPNLATMLCVVLTDAACTPASAQQALEAAVDESFHCISVDGHTSTNDAVLLVANGASGMEPLAGEELEVFRGALSELCEELARAIPADGEGATHLITVNVRGCVDRKSARQIAKTVAESLLVKTAVSGADPNWGRIISAAGYAGVPINPAGIQLKINGYLVYQTGEPAYFDAQEVSDSIRKHRETTIEMQFAEGEAAARFWSTDLTSEYVRLNAEYHT